MKEILVFISLDRDGWEKQLGGYSVSLDLDLMLFGALKNPYISLLSCDEETINDSNFAEEIGLYQGDRLFLVPSKINELITDIYRQTEFLKEIIPSSFLLTDDQKKALKQSIIEKVSVLSDDSIQFLGETMEFERQKKSGIPHEEISSSLFQNCEGTLSEGETIQGKLLPNGHCYRLEKILIETTDETVNYHIWEATQTSTHERHIILFVTQDFFREREDSLVKLVEQTRQPSSNKIPSVVVPVDLGCISNYVFLVADPLSGISLDTLINKKTQGFSLEEARPCLEAIQKTLVQAHKQGQMRLKFLRPANIFYDSDKKTVTLVDWQISLPSKEKESYKSCETLLAERHSDNADYAPTVSDDVYSLACITYKLLSGNHPFAGKTADVAENKDIRPELINSLNPPQWEALTKGLAFKRQERTQTISEFLEPFLKKTFYDFIQKMVEAPFFVGFVIGGGLLIFTIFYLYFLSGGVFLLEYRQIIPMIREKVESNQIQNLEEGNRLVTILDILAKELSSESKQEEKDAVVAVVAVKQEKARLETYLKATFTLPSSPTPKPEDSQEIEGLKKQVAEWQTQSEKLQKQLNDEKTGHQSLREETQRELNLLVSSFKKTAQDALSNKFGQVNCISPTKDLVFSSIKEVVSIEDWLKRHNLLVKDNHSWATGVLGELIGICKKDKSPDKKRRDATIQELQKYKDSLDNIYQQKPDSPQNQGRQD